MSSLASRNYRGKINLGGRAELGSVLRKMLKAFHERKHQFTAQSEKAMPDHIIVRSRDFPSFSTALTQERLKTTASKLMGELETIFQSHYKLAHWSTADLGKGKSLTSCHDTQRFC